MLHATLGALLAASLPLAGSTAPPASASWSTYDTTVDLLNRASRADQVARVSDGWTVRITTATAAARQREARVAAQLACCDAVRRLATASRANRATSTLAVDLRGGRYRAAGESVADSVLGTPNRVYVGMRRTASVRRALRLVRRPAARWISGSANDPIPAMPPGELYADAAAGSLPSSAVVSMIGQPRNVDSLERVDTVEGTVYRGTVRRFGTTFALNVRFRGDVIVAGAVRYRGTPVLATTWQVGAPDVELPAEAARVGARTMRAAYAYANLPSRTAAAAERMRTVIARGLRRGTASDQEIREYVQDMLGQFALQLGPADILIPYSVHLTANGGRISVRNRFGARSRSITWDAARQRLRVTPVR